MLVICNGAIKSGSTWLYNILYELKTFSRPPSHYLTEASRRRSRNPCIDPTRLAEFLDREDVSHNDYLSKNHIGRIEHRDLLMSNASVYVFDIERDVRDMVVSSYYDDCNRNGYQGSFQDYYWEQGRYVADEVIRYHDKWRGAGSRFLMVSYEGLHQDFAQQVEAIAKTLSIHLTQDAIAAIRDKTSIGSLRNRYKDEKLYQDDKFFRKGVVGDWQNHFDGAIAADIEAIQRKGIGRFDVRRLRRRVRHTLSRLR